MEYDINTFLTGNKTRVQSTALSEGAPFAVLFSPIFTEALEKKIID